MTAVAKNDVVVEINQDEETMEDDDEQVMEIRFFITNTNQDGSAATVTPEVPNILSPRYNILAEIPRAHKTKNSYQ